MSIFQGLSWNPSEHSDEENLRWSWLRAVEWGIWPAFLSGPVVPLLLLFFEWWKIIGVVAILTILWSFIRYKYINLAMARFGVYFVFLKWIACPLAAIYLIVQHNYILAILAILWPMLAASLGIFVGGTQIGILQKMFMNKLGYLENKI
jgi:hypothetical protein